MRFNAQKYVNWIRYINKRRGYLYYGAIWAIVIFAVAAFPWMAFAQETDATMTSSPKVIVEDTAVGEESALGENEFYSSSGKTTAPATSAKPADPNWPATIEMKCTVEIEPVSEGTRVRVKKGCAPLPAGARRLSFNGAGMLSPLVWTGWKGIPSVETYVVLLVLKSKDGQHLYTAEKVEVELKPADQKKWEKEVELKFTHLPAATSAYDPGDDAPALVVPMGAAPPAYKVASRRVVVTPPVE